MRRYSKAITRWLAVLCLFGLTACGWPATVEVASESSSIGVRGTVPFGAQNGSVTIRAQYPFEPFTWLWLAVDTPTLTSPSANNLSVNAAADWSASFRMPSWAWRDGAQGSFARYFVQANSICGGGGVTCDFDLASEPVDAACASKALADGVKVAAGFCRPPSLGPGSQVPALLMGYPAMSADDVARPTYFLKETGYYFHACTADFVPEGSHRRSYCDRPYVNVKDTNGKVTKILTEYAFADQSPARLIQSVSWVGDGSTILAMHDTHYQGRYTRNPRVRYYPYFGSRDSSTPNSWSAGAYDERVTLIDLGECSVRVSWDDVMNGIGQDFEGFLALAAPLIEETFKSASQRVGGNDRITSATVTNLRITVRAAKPANSPPDAPRYFQTGPILLHFNVHADGRAGRQFDAEIELGLGLEIRSGKAIARAESSEILWIDADGAFWQNRRLDDLKNAITGIAGTEFDLSADLLKIADALLSPQDRQIFEASRGRPFGIQDLRRAVIALNGLHVILAEDGADANYVLLGLAGLCEHAASRIGPLTADASWWP